MIVQGSGRSRERGMGRGRKIAAATGVLLLVGALAGCGTVAEYDWPVRGQDVVPAAIIGIAVGAAPLVVYGFVRGLRRWRNDPGFRDAACWLLRRGRRRPMYLTLAVSVAAVTAVTITGLFVHDRRTAIIVLIVAVLAFTAMAIAYSVDRIRR
jgi:hypothetical protein